MQESLDENRDTCELNFILQKFALEASAIMFIGIEKCYVEITYLGQICNSPWGRGGGYGVEYNTPSRDTPSRVLWCCYRNLL